MHHMYNFIFLLVYVARPVLCSLANQTKYITSQTFLINSNIERGSHIIVVILYLLYHPRDQWSVHTILVDIVSDPDHNLQIFRPT